MRPSASLPQRFYKRRAIRTWFTRLRRSRARTSSEAISFRPSSGICSGQFRSASSSPATPGSGTSAPSDRETSVRRTYCAQVTKASRPRLSSSTRSRARLRWSLAITSARLAGLATDASLMAGLAAFLGHIFPVWLNFKGGKGVATYIGVILGLYWPAALLFCAVWIAVAYLTRYSSLSALAASAVLPRGTGSHGRGSGRVPGGRHDRPPALEAHGKREAAR